MNWRTNLAVCAAALAVGFATGQVVGSAPSSPKVGEVLTAPDVGVKFDGRTGNEVVGRLVVRIDGKWLEVQRPALPSVVPAQPR